MAPLIAADKQGGNKPTVDLREVVDSVMYVLGTGCQWWGIPGDLAPRSTAFGYLARWACEATLEAVSTTTLG